MKFRKYIAVLAAVLMLTIATSAYARTTVMHDDVGAFTGPALYGRYANLQALITAIGNVNSTTVIVNEQLDMGAAAVTVPINITLDFTRQGAIAVTAVQTLTFAASFDQQVIAEPTQRIFVVTVGGTVVATTSGTSRPNWWQYNSFPGTTDMTTAIQAAIDSLPTGKVVFVPESYLTSANINLKSNVDMFGYGTTLTIGAAANSWVTESRFFHIENANNIDIQGFTFDGEGAWTAVPFANPYGGGNSVGFTNNHIGVYTINTAGPVDNIKISYCNFLNSGHGIKTVLTSNITITNNYFNNLGYAGITATTITEFVFSNNTMNGIYGNITAAGVVDVNLSLFADGIYIYSSQRGTVTGNVIRDLIRIGIVLEGDTIILTSGVVISNNTISNIHNGKLGSPSAGIWSELTTSDRSNIAIGNTLDNTGAAAGAEYSRGITGTHLTMIGNYIRGFDHGIAGYDYRAYNNVLENNGEGGGMTVGAQAVEYTTDIVGNHIRESEGPGITVASSHGTINIRSNTIEDNGQDPHDPADASGIFIIFYYWDQTVWITDNTFISSADEGDVVGQLWGILGNVGGDLAWTTNNIYCNRFSFTGVFTTEYPGNLAVAPMTFTTQAFVTVYELGPPMNINSKITQIRANTASSSLSMQIIVEYDTVSPTTGLFNPDDLVTSKTFREGDVVVNSLPGAGDPIGWTVVKSEESTANGGEIAGSINWDVIDQKASADLDIIGVMLDNGTMHWTSINGAPGGNIITVLAGVPAGRTIANGERIMWFLFKGYGVILP